MDATSQMGLFAGLLFLLTCVGVYFLLKKFIWISDEEHFRRHHPEAGHGGDPHSFFGRPHFWQNCWAGILRRMGLHGMAHRTSTRHGGHQKYATQTGEGGGSPLPGFDTGPGKDPVMDDSAYEHAVDPRRPTRKSRELLGIGQLDLEGLGGGPAAGGGKSLKSPRVEDRSALTPVGSGVGRTESKGSSRSGDAENPALRPTAKKTIHTLGSFAEATLGPDAMTGTRMTIVLEQQYPTPRKSPRSPRADADGGQRVPSPADGDGAAHQGHGQKHSAADSHTSHGNPSHQSHHPSQQEDRDSDYDPDFPELHFNSHRKPYPDHIKQALEDPRNWEPEAVSLRSGSKDGSTTAVRPAGRAGDPSPQDTAISAAGTLTGTGSATGPAPSPSPEAFARAAEHAYFLSRAERDEKLKWEERDRRLREGRDESQLPQDPDSKRARRRGDTACTPEQKGVERGGASSGKRRRSGGLRSPAAQYKLHSVKHGYGGDGPLSRSRSPSKPISPRFAHGFGDGGRFSPPGSSKDGRSRSPSSPVSARSRMSQTTSRGGEPGSGEGRWTRNFRERSPRR